MYILTVDLGTTFFKACLFDSTKLVYLAKAKTPIERAKEGQAEIAPPKFCQTIINLFNEIKQNCPKEFTKVSRMSFATQANSFLLLDKNDKPLTPIILWTDLRGLVCLSEIEPIYSPSEIYQTTGVTKTSAQMMPAKLAWIKNNHLDIWNGAGKLCSISDYLVYWLTGEHISEAGAAGLTSMVDIHNLKWTDKSIAALGLDDINLPKIVRAGSLVGKLKSDKASLFGLSKNCELVMGCLDQYAGAIGAGNTAIGKVSETTGTVMATVSLSQGFNPSLEKSAVLQGPAFAPGKFYAMVAGNVSANLIEEFKNNFAPDLSYHQIDGLAQAVFNRSYLSSDKKISPKEINLGEKLVSIYQKIAAALAAQVDKVTSKKRPKQITCVGGAAASDLLLKCKASKLGATTIALDCQEPTSLGAAILAQFANQPIENAPETKIRAKFAPEN